MTRQRLYGVQIGLIHKDVLAYSGRPLFLSCRQSLSFQDLLTYFLDYCSFRSAWACFRSHQMVSWVCF